MPPNQIINNPHISKKLPPWNKMRWVILLLLLPLLIVIYGTLLLLLYKFFSPSYTNAIFYCRPATGAWYFAGIVLTVATGGLWMNKIYQLYQNARYKSFPLHTQRPRFEAFGFLKALAWLFGTVALAFIILICDNYILIYKDRIIINELVSFDEKTYPVQEVKSITYVERVKVRGKLKHNPRHIVQFSDGSAYETKNNMLDEKAAIEFLASQNKIRIDTLITE